MNKSDEQCECKGRVAMPPDHTCKYTISNKLTLVNALYFEELLQLEQKNVVLVEALEHYANWWGSDEPDLETAKEALEKVKGMN